MDFDQPIRQLTNGEVRELPVDSALSDIDPKVLAAFQWADLCRAQDDLQFAYGYTICGHLSLSPTRQLVICTNAAGSGTKHESTGRCRQHDSLLISVQPRSPYVAHLREYADLQSIFETFQSREKKLNDLSDELGIARSLLALQLRDLEHGKRARNEEVFRNCVLALEMIRKIAESIAKIQLNESIGITFPAVEAFLWQISEILNQEIEDPTLRIRILDRVASEASFVQ